MNHREYKGEAYIYSHGEVLDLLREMAKKLLPEKDSRYIDDRLHFVEISDGEKIDLIGCETLFFDIHSSKAKQFGFCMNIDSKRKLTCEALGIKNLLLYHTEDKNLANRKKLYMQEGQQYYTGKLWIPDDFETIEL